MQHTQGSWEMAEDEHLIEVFQEGQGTICLIDMTDRSDEKKARDDARLIAAAPNLLEALETIGAWLVSPATDKDTVAYMRAIVLAAISKATGQ